MKLIAIICYIIAGKFPQKLSSKRQYVLKSNNLVKSGDTGKGMKFYIFNLTGDLSPDDTGKLTKFGSESSNRFRVYPGHTNKHTLQTYIYIYR